MHSADLLDNARIIQSCVGIPPPRYSSIAQNPDYFVNSNLSENFVLQLFVNISNYGLCGTSVPGASTSEPSGTFTDTYRKFDLVTGHGTPNPPKVSRSQGHTE